MAKPFTRNLTIYQGATFRDKVRWQTRESDQDPYVPVDLTGCTARCQYRERAGAAGVLLELTTENGGIVLGGAAGTIERVITAAQTAAITWSRAVYDLEIVLANGDVRRFMQGEDSVEREVTR